MFLKHGLEVPFLDFIDLRLYSNLEATQLLDDLISDRQKHHSGRLGGKKTANLGVCRENMGE